jgi:hypothetical protein
MRPYLKLTLVFSLVILTSVQFCKLKEASLFGKYVIKGLVRQELTLKKKHRFEIQNSSHIAGHGSWKEYGNWRSKNDTIILSIEYYVSDGVKKEEHETIILFKNENDLCKNSSIKGSNHCYIKAE